MEASVPNTIFCVATVNTPRGRGQWVAWLITAQISLTTNTGPSPSYSFIWTHWTGCMCMVRNSSFTAQSILLRANFFRRVLGHYPHYSQYTSNIGWLYRIHHENCSCDALGTVFRNVQMVTWYYSVGTRWSVSSQPYSNKWRCRCSHAHQPTDLIWRGPAWETRPVSAPSPWVGRRSRLAFPSRVSRIERCMSCYVAGDFVPHIQRSLRHPLWDWGDATG